jgi:hypothetical protein
MWDRDRYDFRDVSYMFDMTSLCLKRPDVMDTISCYQIYYSVDDASYRLVLEDTDAVNVKAAFHDSQGMPGTTPKLLAAFSGSRDVTSLLMEFAGPGHDFSQGCLRLKYLKPYGIETLQIMDSCINDVTFTDDGMIICPNNSKLIR